MILKNGIDLLPKLSEFIVKSKRLLIFSPYIKLETLKLLINNQSNVEAILVRWNPIDLLMGSSDTEIFPFLKDKGIPLYYNTRLHLKAYVDNYEQCFLTTANISSRALNTPSRENFNYELGSVLGTVNIEDRLYFNLIISESTLVTPDIYSQIIAKVEELRKKTVLEIPEAFQLEEVNKQFLISSLPMTYSVETLYRIYEDREFISDIELSCALHDLATYKIPLGLTSEEFRSRLKEAFFSHPFVIGFLNQVHEAGEIYFGTAKEWIHRNCSDVPTPRKWEITTNIQILYRWIVKLGGDTYIVDRPNYSERLQYKP